MPAVQETWVQFLVWKDPLEKGNVNPLQYSCLKNPMDRGAWQATVHGAIRVRHDLVTKPSPSSSEILVHMLLRQTEKVTA